MGIDEREKRLYNIHTIECSRTDEEKQVNREQLVEDILSLTNEQAEYVLSMLKGSKSEEVL